jgi:DNA-directed RNA polymerase specialized sigma24 family protein
MNFLQGLAAPATQTRMRERAFREIYAAHGAAIHAYLARRVPPEAVEDLASETFMVAWRKMPDDVEEPLAWLYAVARREVMAQRRRESGRTRLVERLTALTPRHEGVAVLPLAGPALEPPLSHAFARLTDNEKEALLLVAWEGLDHAQAGRVVGCSAATFTVRLSRARAKLRAALTPSQPSVAREGTA